MYPPSQAFGSVIRPHRATGLENNIAFIILFIHIMYADARFPFTGIGHRFVNLYAVHSFSAVFGKQGRVDIDDPARIHSKQGRGDQPEKAGKDNECNIMFDEQLRDLICFVKCFTAEDMRRDPEIPGPAQDKCIRVVA